MANRWRNSSVVEIGVDVLSTEVLTVLFSKNAVIRRFYLVVTWLSLNKSLSVEWGILLLLFSPFNVSLICAAYILEI